MTIETLVQSIMESASELTDAEINQIAEEAAARFGADADGVKLLLLSGTERFRAAMFEATHNKELMTMSTQTTEAWNIQHRPKGEWRWIEWGQFDYSDANYLKVQSDLKQRATQNGASYRVFDAHDRIVFQAQP